MVFSPSTLNFLPRTKGLELLINKTPAKALTPPAEPKMGTRPGRAVTREFIEGGVYSLISVLPN